MYYNDIIITENMYIKYNNNLTKYLEEIDSGEQYIGSNLIGLDAFERQLKRFDIRVGDDENNSSNNISDFFQNEQTVLLLPEYVRRKSTQYIQEFLYEMKENKRIETISRLSDEEIRKGSVNRLCFTETIDKVTGHKSGYNTLHNFKTSTFSETISFYTEMLNCRITELDNLIRLVCKCIIKNICPLSKISNFNYANSIFVDYNEFKNAVKSYVNGDIIGRSPITIYITYEMHNTYDIEYEIEIEE